MQNEQSSVERSEGDPIDDLETVDVPSSHEGASLLVQPTAERVLLDFSESITRIALHPDQARRLARLLEINAHRVEKYQRKLAIEAKKRGQSIVREDPEIWKRPLEADPRAIPEAERSR